MELGWLSKREHIAKVLLLLKHWGKAFPYTKLSCDKSISGCIFGSQDTISPCISWFCHSRVVVTRCITILDFNFHNRFIWIPELNFFFLGRKHKIICLTLWVVSSSVGRALCFGAVQQIILPLTTELDGMIPFCREHGGWSKPGHMGNDFSCHLHFAEDHVTTRPAGLLVHPVNSK